VRVTVDVVVSRYGEDLSWVKSLPPEWRVIVYDKTAGGPRDDSFRKDAGPDGGGRIWPGAIVRRNIGCEAETYLAHIAERYDRLADVNVFLQGDAPRHVDDIIDRLREDVESISRLNGPVPGHGHFGPILKCSRDGRPHHRNGLPEIEWMADVFGIEVPETMTFKAFALFWVTRTTLQTIRQVRWQLAAKTCQTRRLACGMERIWELVLQQATNQYVAAFNSMPPVPSQSV
jgi:hypothetical protein